MPASSSNTADRPALSAPLIAARHLTVQRGGNTLLADATMELEAGTLAVVVGPNGGGKTTLLRVMLGLSKPDTGTVHRSPSLRVGYVPQSFARDPSLPISTADFLRHGGGLHTPLPPWMAPLGLAPILSTPLSGLSGGEFKRAALARALLRKPQLLVLDEPLAGVDAASQPGIYELVRSYQRQSGGSVLVVMHDILAAIQLASRLICLDTRILADGPTRETVRHPAFVQMVGAEMAQVAQNMTIDGDGAGGRPGPRIVAHG